MGGASRPPGLVAVGCLSFYPQGAPPSLAEKWGGLVKRQEVAVESGEIVDPVLVCIRRSQWSLLLISAKLGGSVIFSE